MSEAATRSIPLAEPYLAGNTRRYLEECLESNYVSSVGPFVERFETEFAAAVGARHAVACASGTAAIHVALRVLGVGPGDEVLVPTLTFIASANPVRYLGAIPVLVDAEPETWNMDPQLVADELDRRARLGLPQPRAVEVVHLLGHPAKLEPVIEACERHGVPIVEDAAESLGATWVEGPLAGRQVGTIGAVGCFSFNGNKVITTGGGGMLVTDDPGLARRAKHLTTQARLPGLAYDHDEIGYNYRLSNIAAALGLAQLEQLPAFLARKRATASAYDRALASIPGIEPPPHAAWADPTFWLYTPRLGGDSALGRDELLAGLRADGVQARPIWTPLHTLPPHRDAPVVGGRVAEEVFGRAISLPSSVGLRDEDRGRVVEALSRLLA